MTLWGEALMVGGDPIDISDLFHRPAWMADAACREHPELPWVPKRGVNGGQIATMRAVCAACLVRDECLTFAVAGDEGGFWGGTSTNERQGVANPVPPPASHPCAGCGAEIVGAASTCSNRCKNRVWKARQSAA